MAKMLRRSYVSEDELKKNRKCLDYFGPFHLNDICVNLALEQSTQKEDDNPAPAKQARLKSSDEDVEDEAPLDLIVCENESRTKVVCEIARHLGEPYVPFKLLFVEGIVQAYDGDMAFGGANSVPMMPVALVIGDYHNVFCLNRINTRSNGVTPMSLRKMHKKNSFWDYIPEWGAKKLLESSGGDGTVNLKDGFKFDVNEADEYCYDRISECPNHLGYSLKLAFGSQDFQADLMKFIFDDPYTEKTEGMFRVLPGNGGSINTTTTAGSFFHRDERGMSAFTRKEAKKTSAFIASFGLEDRIKESE